MVVKADPVRDHAAGVLQGIEPVAVHALIFDRSDHALDHAVLLWAVRGDEFLLQAKLFNEGALSGFIDARLLRNQHGSIRWRACANGGQWLV